MNSNSFMTRLSRRLTQIHADNKSRTNQKCKTFITLIRVYLRQSAANSSSEIAAQGIEAGLDIFNRGGKGEA